MNNHMRDWGHSVRQYFLPHNNLSQLKSSWLCLSTMYVCDITVKEEGDEADGEKEDRRKN